MLVEIGKLALAVVLVAYGTFAFHRWKDKRMLYFTVAFIALAFSAVFIMIESFIFLYAQTNIVILRLLEFADLAFFVCFTLFIIFAISRRS